MPRKKINYELMTSNQIESLAIARASSMVAKGSTVDINKIEKMSKRYYPFEKVFARKFIEHYGFRRSRYSEAEFFENRGYYCGRDAVKRCLSIPAEERSLQNHRTQCKENFDEFLKGYNRAKNEGDFFLESLVYNKGFMAGRKKAERDFKNGVDVKSLKKHKLTEYTFKHAQSVYRGLAQKYLDGYKEGYPETISKLLAETNPEPLLFLYKAVQSIPAPDSNIASVPLATENIQDQVDSWLNLSLSR